MMKHVSRKGSPMKPSEKYRPYPAIDLSDRQWPSRSIERAPDWCSVDLRDGNQALKDPMTVEKKIEFFRLLTDIGFKEIEVGFPSASDTEHAFTRRLIEENHIPPEVAIQVLTQSRDHLIARTFQSIRGARRVIVHLYNSTSTLQRRVVFRMNRRQIIDLAVRGAEQIRREAEKLEGADVRYEYSPESFTGTEMEFAVEICEAVMDVWEPAPERKVILNLPATVEMATPNVYADQIEWFGRQLSRRENAIISLHAHNDRGTAVAATELALMAGAERVEGTLFGNGERTGNVDLVTLALNLYSQGIDPGLDFRDINGVVDTYCRCTRMPVHMRHPYAGELVYTAFSGSHQDAISKGMKEREEKGACRWEVPYLPIDPEDIGRTYESIIRINSQSGKGGVSYVLEQEYGYVLPKKMHPEVGALIQGMTDRTGEEVSPSEIRKAFEDEYLRREKPFTLENCRIESGQAPDSAGAAVKATVRRGDRVLEIAGEGNGPIDAFCSGLKREAGVDFTLLSYHEHALGSGSGSKAVCYVEIEVGESLPFFGVGVDASISVAAFRAVLCALNRSMEERD